MSKVSIAIPTYNRKEYLRDCINSILAQTFQDFEIIVFDNCSNYDIGLLIDSFHDKRIRLVRNSSNVGVYKNFQNIYNFTFDSPFVMIFHDDDAMHPFLLQIEYNLIIKYKVGIVACLANFIKDKRKILDFNERFSYKEILCQDQRKFIELILNDYDICYDSALYKKDAISKMGRLSERFDKWSDRPEMIEVAKIEGAVIVNKRLVNYRLHRDQDSQNNLSVSFEKLFNLFQYYNDNLGSPLSYPNKKLFLSFTTNNIILSAVYFSNNWQGYFEVLRRAKKCGIFDIKFLNIRGIYYFAKAMFLMMKRKNA